MSSRLLVRAAAVDDVEFLVDGNARMAWETERLELDRERLRAGVEAVFMDAGRGFYLIAELDGERAAQMMITYEWSDWRNGVFWWIQSVYTVPGMRGRGAFRALYDAVDAMAREQGGVCGLRLYVEAHNETAQATYRRCGMSETVYRMFEVAR
jgi:GNAT superfamily N-acetyltransferase